MALTAEEEGKIRAIISIYDAQAPSLSTDVAAMCPALFGQWVSSGHAYVKGEKVSYNGVVYVCISDHTSQDSWTPSDAPSLWTKAIDYAASGDNPSSIPDWVTPSNENPYPKGAVVRHNGKVWESLVENNVWEPGVSGTESVWREVAEG